MLQGPEATIRRARGLRKAMSLPEVLLWQRLRAHSRSLKFRRQHPSGPYVADFYCHEARLIVEIDGLAHDMGDNPRRDGERDAWFAARDLHVIRISAADVLADPDQVADAIVRTALPLHQPAAGPPPHASHGEELLGAD